MHVSFSIKNEAFIFSTVLQLLDTESCEPHSFSQPASRKKDWGGFVSNVLHIPVPQSHNNTNHQHQYFNFLYF